MNLSGEAAQRVLASSECIYERAAVEAALDRMGDEINAALSDTELTVLCVLTGGLVTLGQLLPRLRSPLQLDFVHATRYRGRTAGGAIDWLVEPRGKLEDRDLLLVDDILDEGYTLAAIQAYCRGNGARSVHTAVLVEKLHERKHPEAHADFVGLTVEDRYVFGYGMDYNDYLRNAPGIYALPETQARLDRS
jgi:hypoxanthine phosphoribosyltransferase